MSIVFRHNDCGREAPNRPGGGSGRVVVAGACSSGDFTGCGIQRDLGQQFTGGGLADRPRVTRVGRPPGGTAYDMVWIGHAELGQRGTVVDTIVGAKAAQIPPPRVDLDWLYGPSPRAI
jgi:hypothetical protein